MATRLQKAAYFTVISFGAIAAAWVFFEYLFDPLMPFLIAAILSLIAVNISKKLSRTLHIPQKPLSVIILLLLCGALIGVISSAAIRLTREADMLYRKLSDSPQILTGSIDSLTAVIDKKLSDLSGLIPSVSLESLGISPSEILLKGINSLVSHIASALPQTVLGIISRLPSAMLSVIALFTTAFLLCTDGDKMLSYIKGCLSSKAKHILSTLKRSLAEALLGYLKAYLMLSAITFCMLFIGLSFIGIEYAFLIGILIAIVDMLPIIGSGTVLIPWSLISFLLGAPRRGASLLILYAAIVIVRQLIEPRIVGKSLGLHPIFTLMSVILGMKLLGAKGIFIGPLAALFIKELSKLHYDARSTRLHQP